MRGAPSMSITSERRDEHGLKTTCAAAAGELPD
jgi:hypothetical protein